MLDEHLADLYGVETKVLIQAVKRNSGRFPEDFMFQLSTEEWALLRSQTVTSKGRGGRRYAPYAFTEHGALMLSSVLRSTAAESFGLLIVRSFVQLREMLSSHKELAAKLEALEGKVGGHDQAITSLLEAIRQLMLQPTKQSRSIGFTADGALDGGIIFSCCRARASGRGEERAGEEAFAVSLGHLGYTHFTVERVHR